MQSLVECLHNTKPHYSSLHTFGCACWPNLRPYSSHKLVFRSTQYVFLGYSSLHKAFKCLEPSFGRVHISWDFVFDEHMFPFATLHPHAGSRLCQEILILQSHMHQHLGSPISHAQHLGFDRGGELCTYHMSNFNPITSDNAVQFTSENGGQIST